MYRLCNKQCCDLQPVPEKRCLTVVQTGHTLTGNCCFMQAVAFAKKYVLEKGPIVLEMDTYRYHGHSMSDPGSTYRTRDEISSMRQLRDPIEHVRKLLLEKAGADPSELKKIEKVSRTNLDTLALATVVERQLG